MEVNQEGIMRKAERRKAKGEGERKTGCRGFFCGTGLFFLFFLISSVSSSSPHPPVLFFLYNHLFSSYWTRNWILKTAMASKREEKGKISSNQPKDTLHGSQTNQNNDKSTKGEEEEGKARGRESGKEDGKERKEGQNCAFLSAPLEIATPLLAQQSSEKGKLEHYGGTLTGVTIEISPKKEMKEEWPLPSSLHLSDGVITPALTSPHQSDVDFETCSAVNEEEEEEDGREEKKMTSTSLPNQTMMGVKPPLLQSYHASELTSITIEHPSQPPLRAPKWIKATPFSSHLSLHNPLKPSSNLAKQQLNAPSVALNHHKRSNRGHDSGLERHDWSHTPFDSSSSDSPLLLPPLEPLEHMPQPQKGDIKGIEGEEEQKTPHWVHGVLCLSSCGLWLPFWIASCSGLFCTRPFHTITHCCDHCLSNDDDQTL